MYLPPLQPVSNSDIRISGDVKIHPSAVLAPGVILQAAPNSSIVIGAEVCIGMGAILNAYQGCIEIESGAILGSGVLVIGTGKIGTNACVGTATTIFNASVPSMAAIAPGSVVGDTSRQVKVEGEIFEPSTTTNGLKDESTNTNNFSATQSQSPRTQTKKTTAQADNTSGGSSSATAENTEDAPVDIELDTNGSQAQQTKEPIVGEVYINQLLLTLFPHNQHLNRSTPKDEE